MEVEKVGENVNVSVNGGSFSMRKGSRKETCGVKRKRLEGR